MKKILVINAGSSSLKFQLMDMTDESVIAKGMCERIGIANSVLKYKPAGREDVLIKKDMKDHVDAIQLVLDALADKEHGVLKGMDEILAVGHRVVHGGESFSGSVAITGEVMKALRDNIELAPLHNPANIMGIEACQKLMPSTPMVGVFDTAFHQTMPDYAYIYGLPYEDYTELRVRRYGFHGTSHYYVANRVAEVVGKPIEELKIVTCHLGNGSSIAAVKGGKSVDTSMGFTPLEGVPMGTRSGSIDPAIITYLMDKRSMDVPEMNGHLNKKSGVLGVSGVSSDFRDLGEATDEGNVRAKLALEVFSYAVKKCIGAYAAAMNGVDVVVFTAGIGENDTRVREMCMRDMEYLGVDFDFEANKNFKRGAEVLLTKPGSKAQVWVVPTNEELVIARDTLKLVK